MDYSVFFDYIHKWFEHDLGFFREDYVYELEQYNTVNVIKVIAGLRRVGKSYILKQFMNQKIQTGVSGENFFYLHLEDYRLGEDLSIAKIGEIFSYYRDTFHPTWTIYICLDEIQNVPSWERLVRTWNEQYQGQAQIYLTGSNSKLLSGELATSLTGRFVQIEVFPLSFRDVLTLQEKGIPQSIDPIKNALFENYLTYGGLPEVVRIENIESKKNYLITLVDSILFKDIIRRHNLRKTQLLTNLIKYAFSTTTSLLSVHSILKYLKDTILSLDYETVDNYLSYLEASYLLSPVSSLHNKTKEVLKGNTKYYAFDLGIRNWYGGNMDIEKNLENFVYLELRRRGYTVTILRTTDSEIDFFAVRGGEKEYYQVAYTIDKQATYDREMRPLLLQRDTYPKYILTLDAHSREDRGVQIRNVIDWALEERQK